MRDSNLARYTLSVVVSNVKFMHAQNLTYKVVYVVHIIIRSVQVLDNVQVHLAH